MYNEIWSRSTGGYWSYPTDMSVIIAQTCRGITKDAQGYLFWYLSLWVSLGPGGIG
jgi:hypothetical protein